MKVCIDARWIHPEISGIGLYTKELARALAGADRVNEYVLLFDDPAVMERTLHETGLADAPNVATRLVGYGPHSTASQLRLPALMRELRADVFHSTNYMMPLRALGTTRRVVTIHDLIPLLVRDHAPRSRKSRALPVFRRLLLEIVRRADLVITVSESTRLDVLRTLAVAPDRNARIVAIPEGVSPEYRPTIKRPRAVPVILYVGRRDPYKNLPLLVEAVGRLKADGVRARLRVVGPPDDRYPEAPRRARELGLDADIDWVGYVTAEELLREYQQADVFCLPSRYEGFGLPVLEAMACGTPVVCGNKGSLTEVAGDAALLVDPDDADRIAQALRRVLADPETAPRLSAKGLERAAMFTWNETARRTLDAYRQAMER
jgi:glycosyltransferase involved in cell wall biosynthesis